MVFPKRHEGRVLAVPGLIGGGGDPCQGSGHVRGRLGLVGEEGGIFSDSEADAVIGPVVAHGGQVGVETAKLCRPNHAGPPRQFVEGSPRGQDHFQVSSGPGRIDRN